MPPISHRFVPYDDLGRTPNIVVDGAAHEQTGLILSHWPGSGTPPPLLADTSTEIVFNYLERPEFHLAVEAVSNNHFDEDGLIGIYVLCAPDDALARRDLLIDVATAGDFAKFNDRRAARIAFTIDAYSTATASPLGRDFFGRPYPQLCGALYQALLPEVPGMLAHTEDYAELWRAEDALLDESERAVDAGDVVIEEAAEADLAVVRIADGAPCHRMSINNRTGCNRVLTVRGASYGFHFRYESWVQYASRRPPPRVDLAPLATRLTAMERGDARWHADAVDGIRPGLHMSGASESTIPADRLITLLSEHLRTAPPAWDPYVPRQRP